MKINAKRNPWSREQIEAAFESLRGKIDQVPRCILEDAGRPQAYEWRAAAKIGTKAGEGFASIS